MIAPAQAVSKRSGCATRVCLGRGASPSSSPGYFRPEEKRTASFWFQIPKFKRLQDTRRSPRGRRLAMLFEDMPGGPGTRHTARATARSFGSGGRGGYMAMTGAASTVPDAPPAARGSCVAPSACSGCYEFGAGIALKEQQRAQVAVIDPHIALGGHGRFGMKRYPGARPGQHAQVVGAVTDRNHLGL